MINQVLYFVISFAIMGLSYYYLYGRKTKKADPQPQQVPQVRQPQPQQQQQQQRPVIGRRTVQDSDEEDDEQDIDATAAEQQAKREAKKQQKQAHQAYLKQQYELKEKKNQEKNKYYEEQNRLREEQELKEEEWKLKIQEDQRRQEQEEFDKWKSLITVEQSGTDKLSEEEEKKKNTELMDKLCRHIKLRKVVQLEELSSEFNLSTQDIVDRIRQLEEQKLLIGLIDERGKYIYLKQSEIDAVINFINAKGRVSRSDLLRECNQLIKLDPSKQDQQLIQEESKQLMSNIEQEINM